MTEGLLRLCAAAMLALLCACGGDGPGAGTLRIGTNVWPGYEPLYLARDLAFYDATPVRLVEYSSASQVSRAFRNGAIDAAALTLDEVLRLAQHDFEPCVVLVLDVSMGGDAILAKPAYTDLASLRGRRIGVESTALGAYVLSRALQQAGMDEADVHIVPLEVDEHERAFLDGRLDAVVTFEPVRSRLLAAGAVQVFDSRAIPGEVVDVLVVRRDALAAQPRAAASVVDGWYRALDFMQAQRGEAMRRFSARMRLGPEQTARAFEGLDMPTRSENRRLLGDAAAVPATAARLMRLMRERGLLHHHVEVAPLFSCPGSPPG